MTESKTPASGPNKGGRKPKADTVPLADHKQVLDTVDSLIEQNKKLMANVEALQSHQGILMKGHKPFTELEVEQAKQQIIETSTSSQSGEYRYEILPTFGEDRIPFKRPFVFSSDTAPRFTEETETGEVDSATARTVLTEYNIFSGSEFQSDDMVVTCTDTFARGR